MEISGDGELWRSRCSQGHTFSLFFSLLIAKPQTFADVMEVKTRKLFYKVQSLVKLWNSFLHQKGDFKPGPGEGGAKMDCGKSS